MFQFSMLSSRIVFAESFFPSATTGSLKWKHVMHLVRLLLLSIRNGEMTWEEVNDWRLALHKQFDEAHESTKLPDRPDYVWANDYLIRCRKGMVR
ncbi:MAG: hypothetical protein IPG59_01720 [Candidatus Melainabacteria bacterium]|nr:MAG: hypothetical protein IPG59_01720 [Candidatus Melainabacteria bacterium]